MTSLSEALDLYERTYPEESEIITRFRRLLEKPDAFLRTCRPGHFTASALILDDSRSRVLLVKHRKLGIWVQPGGHADGEENLLNVTRREVEEETGLSGCRAENFVLDLDIHPIPRRKEESAHDHYDVRFLFFADPSLPLVISDESDALQWVDIETLSQYTQDESMLRMLHKAGIRFSV